MERVSELIDIRELAWAAGLLEGEGCFTWLNGYPTITIEMTDKDVIERYAALFPTKRKRKVMQRPNKNYIGSGTPRLDSFRYEFSGPQAVSVMFMLWPFMGERRRAKIEEIITTWRKTNYKTSPGAHRHGGRNYSL